MDKCFKFEKGPPKNSVLWMNDQIKLNFYRKIENFGNG